MTSEETTAEEGSSPLPVLTGFMTISRAAEVLGLTRQSVHDMTKLRKLRAWRIPSGGSQPDPVVVDSDQVLAMKATQAPVVDVTG